MFLRKMGVLILSAAVSGLLTVSFPHNGTAEEIFPENFKKLSSLYSYNDENPYISGDFVVWAAKSGPMAMTHQIMLYDLSANKELRLTNNSFDNTSPAVDGQFKLVVYKSVRNGLHGIYVCQYDPAQAVCPEVKISEDANYKYYTEIEGNRIVWVEFASTAPYKRMYYCDYDFSGSCPKQMAAGGDSISRPNLEGNLLLWEDRTAYDGGTETEHLFLHDLSTGKTYDLDKGDNNIGNMAAVDGNTVVWAKQKYNASLSRWERVLVSCEYKPQDAPTVCSMREIDTTMGKTTLYAPAHPSIAGPRVVYNNSLERDPGESVSMNHDIYHYNLGTGEILRLTTEVTSQANPMVSGNRVVWREADAFNNIFIWLYEFKAANKPPVLDPIGNKTVVDSDVISFSVAATDGDAQTLSFTQPLPPLNTPEWSFVTTASEAGLLKGAFRWVPRGFLGHLGDHYVLFEVTDNELFDSELMTITVLPAEVALHEVMVEGGYVKVRYSKNFVTCAHLVAGDESVVHRRNFYCTQGNNVEVIQPLAEFTIQGGQSLKLCHGNNRQICSPFVTVGGLPYCGDGILNGSEQCDGLAGVGLHQECSANCTLVNLPYCGDGMVNGSEQCDGAAGVGEHQECSAACSLVNLPYCGDGLKNGAEECDGLDGVGLHQECSASCLVVNLPYCGDGIINGSEQCDGTAGVGEHQECTNACLLTNLPYCGDGIVNGIEQCDGVAGIGSYQECSVDCTLVNLPYCGDGIVNGTEQCDGLAGVGEHQECTSVCTLSNVAYCGDGILNGTEECDGTAGVGEHQECLYDCTLVTLPSDPEFVVLTQSHTVYTGSNVTFNVVAQDANGYNLDLQVLEALPKNAVFSSDSTTFNADGTSSVDGTFNWTPSSRQTGTYTLHFEAGDTSGTASVVSDPVTIKVVKPTTTKARR